ncbi:hypothetical protein POM88_042440 [Heracleum sosnowskyi]|uniref:Prolamin-like domain-containing protein n=1 Tax=Heracleum sosnowskyi TaxID=360622 RepID=A0AAD8HGP4_9APIA|nr:hypothetical protein POM88_042440 [Heracleum sosnowskyi]
MAAKSTNLSTMVFLFTLCILTLAPASLVSSLENEHILPPTSSSDANLSSEFVRFVANCGENLTNSCGREIRNDLLGIAEVSGFCCGELVKMGWICHKGMVRLATSVMDNKDEASTFTSNSDRVYFRCAKIVNSLAPSPNH